MTWTLCTRVMSVVDQTAISQKLEQNHGVFYCKVNCTARSMVTVALPSCCLCWVTCKFAKLIPIRTLFHYNPPIDWSLTIMLLPGIFKPTEQMCKLIFLLKTPHEKEWSVGWLGVMVCFFDVHSTHPRYPPCCSFHALPCPAGCSADMETKATI